MNAFPHESDVIHDKTLKRILKSVERLRALKPEHRFEKYEKLVRYIAAHMHDRQDDVLLQTTAVWSLLNLVKLEPHYGPDIMIKSGIAASISHVLRLDSTNDNTRKYASELVRLLCGNGKPSSGDDGSVHMSVLQDGGQQLESISLGTADDSISDQQSAIASFSPYYIDEKNVEILNGLFEDKGMWKDINDSHLALHRLGTALEQDSVDGDSRTVHSSLTDFWDTMNRRYNYPSARSGMGSRARTQSSQNSEDPWGHEREAWVHTGTGTSLTRTRLEEARQHGRRVEKSPTHHTRGRTTSGTYHSATGPQMRRKRFVLTDSLPTNGKRKPAEAVVPDHMARLDPLSMNVTTALRSVVNQKRQQDDGTESEDISILIDARSKNRIDSHIVEDYDGAGSENQFFTRQGADGVDKTRIRAEKLTDMEFLRNFFVAKATLADSQNLISRMQDILELMDRDDTGYVSWKCFSRVLVSLAPKHLLRADVTSFLDAQVDDENDLIDYKEFAISGKVMIIERKEGVKEVLARSWYSRQKGSRALRDGDPSSTYSWKNHVEWYRKRKAEALIWLMRRANRAIQYYHYVSTAQEYLLNAGKWGKALTYLMDCGDRALQAIDAGRVIRASLFERVTHARRYKLKREEARKFLIAVANTVEIKEDGTFVKKVDPVVVELTPQPCPKLSKVYKIKYQAINAIAALKAHADIAEAKMVKRDEAYDWLCVLAVKSLKQHNVHNATVYELMQMGEAAREHCCVLDTALLSLLHYGERALAFFDRQEKALRDLINLGRRSVAFVERKEKESIALRELGMSTLTRLNLRENGFAYLSMRRYNAVRRREMQEVAFQYLSGIPRKMFENEETVHRAHLWLQERVIRAQRHCDACLRAHKKLKTIASRSVATSRIRTVAHADLKQIGYQALRKQFELTWVPIKGNKERLRDEIKRITRNDKRVAVVRRELSEEERWRADLMDAFAALATAFSNGTIAMAGVGRTAERALKRTRSLDADGNELPELGRLGFKRLIQDGKLLGMPKGTADSCYESVDSDASGCVSFDEVWTWFLHQARKKKPGSVHISISTIVPAKERALTALMKRFAANESRSVTTQKDALSVYDS